LANYVNKLQEWTQQIASNGANNELAANTPAINKIASMEAEIKKLMAAIAQMANKSNNGKNINPNTSSGNRDSRCLQNKKPHNIGVYCHSHGCHPAGADHTSETAVRKRTTTRMKQHGPIPLVETHSGHLQRASQSISKTKPRGMANQLPPIDRDWGQHYIQRTILTQLHLTKYSNNYHQTFIIPYPRPCVRLKNTNPLVPQAANPPAGA
jgi:hypothetical protein